MLAKEPKYKPRRTIGISVPGEIELKLNILVDILNTNRSRLIQQLIEQEYDRQETS